MKISGKYLFLTAFVVAAFSCKKDNYSPPNDMLSGALMYQGDTIHLERNAVHFQIYQFGFGRVGPISTDETFSQDGTYSASLFDGTYKLIVPNGEGPFMWKKTASGDPDSVSITMKGNQTVNLEVTPYYVIKSPQITSSGSGGVKASCQLQQVVTDSVNAKGIDFVALYVNNTQFVAGSNNVASVNIAGSAITDMNNIQLSATVPDAAAKQPYMFARIGVKLAGIEDMLFSPLFKVQM